MSDAPVIRTPGDVAAPPRALADEAVNTAANDQDALSGFFMSAGEQAHDSDLDGLSRTLALRNTVELLAFWVATEEYAVEIAHIQEIIKLPNITMVPRVGPSVVGITSLRGTIVPILDLRVVLGLEATPPSRQSRILVLRSETDPLGVLVDKVTSVVRLERDSIEPKPRGMRQEAAEFLDGVGRVGNRMLIVLDVQSLLDSVDRAL
ncbi:MAG TPA: chemotaxis protein CheW [Myxococcota bacterium]|nr:chemotaxis protein CheW [Myxococcota bacterium]